MKTILHNMARKPVVVICNTKAWERDVPSSGTITQGIRLKQ